MPADLATPDAVRRSELPGGVRLVTETVPGVRSVAVGIWIGIGSVDETGEQAGAAHFLEHLLFKGTRRRTAAGIAEEMDAVGGELNAFTAKEHTCYYAHVLDTDVALAVDLLADVVTDAELARTDVELERGVVLEEISMRDDDPEDLLGDLFDETLFGSHPLGRPVIGSEESVRAMSRETLHAFWRGEYTTPRMVVAAAGNLEHDRLAELVAAALAPAANGHADAVAVPPRAATGVRPARSGALGLQPDDSEQAHVMLGVPAAGRHVPGLPVLAVLNNALGGGLSSRLFQQVREQRGLAYPVYSSVARYADAGALSVYAGCAPERLGEVVAVVRDVLAEVAGGGLTEAEVTRAKGALRGGLVLGCEDTASRMNRLGRAELDHGRQRSLTDSLARIEAVTPAEVAALAAGLLDQPLTAAVVGPYDDESALPGSLRDL
ncbi:zinc protease [Pseudonocardia sp. EC080625-04]|uniref:M16 family metallopeptidase n=1 Tax=Pseudonocardia sp. EC080625-04 TaxID=1096868 RepID=UPI0006CB5890|nr:pitrilysin family protein [Pseudonocardia sp. EC080625-04]ALE76460.1 zinc protease [Pseudonocardia sp. EC080625-04]